MVGTKHCCWGECKTDSRYADKWPKSLKELEESGKKVFIPFPKPSRDMAKCKRWLVACSHELVTKKNITRNTYICALRWPSEKVPTAEFPDTLKANLRPVEVSRALAPKSILQFLMIMIRKEVEPTVDESSFIDEECAVIDTYT